MSEVGDYLLKNYYAKYRPNNIPSMGVLESAIEMQKDHIVIVRDDKIKGVAVYLRLTDKTYKMLEKIDIDTATPYQANRMFKENGKNIHFIILVADCMHTILKGIREVIAKENPKTISWWNPDNTRLHRRHL